MFLLALVGGPGALLALSVYTLMVGAGPAAARRISSLSQGSIFACIGSVLHHTEALPDPSTLSNIIL